MRTYDVISEKSVNWCSYKTFGKTWEVWKQTKKSAIAAIEMSDLNDIAGVEVINFRLKGRWNNVYEFQYLNKQGQSCSIRKTIQPSL